MTVWPGGRWAVVGVLGVTALGNVGQAQTWVSNQVALESSLKPELLATAHLLASGVTDVSGPRASPIWLFPDLSAASIDHLERSGQLPESAPIPAQLTNARGLLAVGTWAGGKTQLSPRALFTGRLLTSVHPTRLYRDCPTGALTLPPRR